MPGIAFPGVWQDERARRQFQVHAKVVSHSRRVVATGYWFWRETQEFDVIHVALDVAEMVSAADQLGGLKIFRGGHVRIKEQINLLSPVEESNPTRLRIGRTVTITFGYTPVVEQWLKGMTPLEVLDVTPCKKPRHSKKATPATHKGKTQGGQHESIQHHAA